MAGVRHRNFDISSNYTMYTAKVFQLHFSILRFAKGFHIVWKFQLYSPNVGLYVGLLDVCCFVTAFICNKGLQNTRFSYCEMTFFVFERFRISIFSSICKASLSEAVFIYLFIRLYIHKYIQ